MRTIEQILEAMSALMAATAGRRLTAEEVTAYEGLEAELATARADDQIRARDAAYRVVNYPAGVPNPGAGGGQPDTYAAAFQAYMRSGRPNADLERGPVNAQSEGVPSQGGYLVPDEFRTQLIERMKAFGGIGGIAQRFGTGNGRNVEWPTIDDTGNVGEIVQEGNTFTAGADLVFGSNSLGSYSYVAGGASQTPLRVSLELTQDTAFDLQGLITRLLGTRIGRIQATHFATGTGVEQPLGLVTGITPVQTAANTGSITYNDLVNAIHSVDPAYRATGCRWVWNDTTMGLVEKITDTNGNPIFRGWGANLALGLNEDTVLGYPVTIDQALPNLVINDSTKHYGAFGNISEGYVVRDIGSVELLVNPYNRMANRQVEYTAWARADATQQDLNAYSVLSGKS